MPAERQLTEDAIRSFAENWYVALDQHVGLDDVLALITEDLEFKVPEDTFLGHEGFGRWYAAVTHRFFDEVHTVTKVEPVIEGDRAVVRVLVNWQAKIWDPCGRPQPVARFRRRPDLDGRGRSGRTADQAVHRQRPGADARFRLALSAA